MLEELNSAADAAAENRKTLPDNVELTDASVKKIKEIILKETKKGFNLRVEVKPGGCAGMSYEFSLDDEIKNGDGIIEKDGLKVVIDNASMEKFKGRQNRLR